MKPTAHLKLLSLVVCLSILASLTSTTLARENTSTSSVETALTSATNSFYREPLAPTSSNPYISWTEKAAPPTWVSSFGYAVLGEKIYLIGGHDASGVFTTAMQRYTPSTNTWEVDTGHGGSLAPLPQPRAFGFFCGVISGRIHCMGGEQDGTYKGDHFIYDPATNVWTTGPALPNYPIGQCGTVVNNKMYVFGGWWGSYQNTVYEYSEATGWSTKASMPTARDNATAAVYNGKIYVIGGESGQPNLQQPQNVVEMYDPIADTWTSAAPLPTARNYLGWSGAPTVDGQIYVTAGIPAYAYDPSTNVWQTLNPLPAGAGGSTAVNGVLYTLSPQHIFQGIPASRQAPIDWIEKTPMPVTVGAYGYATLGNQIYLIGGGNWDKDNTTTVQRYTPAINSWEVDTNHGGTLAPLPQPRALLVCGVISGKIHCLGGWQNGAYTGDHFIYDPMANAWTTGTAIPQYPIGQFAAVVNNKMYVMGGWWGSYYNTVYEYSDATGWTSKAPMPTARGNGAAAVYNGKIYAFGGEGGQPMQQLPLGVVEIYDPQTNTWSTNAATMPQPKDYLGGSGVPSANGLIYVIGPDTTNQAYNPATNSWTILTPLPSAARENVTVNGNLYAFSTNHTYQGVTMPWANFHHDAQHTGRSPYNGPQGDHLAWTYALSGTISSSPAVGNDTIYFGASDRKLYAVATDGSLRWAYTTGGGIVSSPAIDGSGTLYVGSQDFKLYAIKPDGTLKWTYTTGNEIHSAPTIGADGTIYFGSFDGKLYAVSPTGTLKCNYNAGSAIIDSPAIGTDGTIYFGSANGRINTINPDCTQKFSNVITGNGVWTSPALSADGNTLYFGADDGYLYATNTITGGLKWKSPWTYGGVQSSPAVGADGTIYVGTQYGNLWALNPSDGSLKWNYYMTLSAWSSPAIGADGTIYFATDYGAIFAMNPNGTIKWSRVNAPDGHYRSSPAIGRDGTLYVGSTNGKLYAFDDGLAMCGPYLGAWSPTTSLPEAIGTPFDGSGQPLVFYDDHVYMFGGQNDTNGFVTDVFYSTINADGTLGPWIATTSLPGQYFDHSVVRVGRYLYFITGADGDIAVYYTPINADGSIGAWLRTADLLPSRQDFAVATNGQYIYVVAGNASGLSKLVKYTSAKPDGSLNPWSDTTQLPSAVQGHTATAYDGYLYAFTPISTTYRAAINGDGTIGTWSTTTNLPQAMSNYNTFNHSTSMYLLGGQSSSVYHAAVLSDHSLGPWHVTTALPAARSRMRTGAYQCYAYAVGGFDGSHYTNTVYYAHFQPAPPCDPVSGVQVSRTPAGDLFTNTAVHFNAGANGTTPFTYTWTLNDAAVGGNLSTYDYTFMTAGTNTVGVTVTNACGQGNALLSVPIQPRPSDLPDLGPSSKAVNRFNVDRGDVLTYTLIVRNASPIAANATLTDSLPIHTAYVPNSLRASSGVVAWASDAAYWSGQVISGTPVVIEFATEVLTATVGMHISNAMELNDGAGHTLTRTAESIYNPGFGLSINDGALFTNIPTVTLSLSWGLTNPPIEEMNLSNDGGFGSGTGWIPVAATRTGWVLATYGNLVMPRTVFIKFRDSNGQPYGPLQDEIIYDPTPPQVTSVEIIAQTSRGLNQPSGQNVIVRVTSSDDNSGVGRIQISSSTNFSRFTEFAASGGTTDIPWTWAASGQVYVRVVDRAGNVSSAVGIQPPYSVYLPLMMR
jgi:uncharacterized repeat protein (TIGR01451 family)